MAYTTTELIAGIKRRAAIPTSQSTFTNTGILALADEEMRTFVLPKVLDSLEHYYEYDVDVAINATGVYDIPTRAVGGQIANLALISNNSRLDLNWITEDGLSRYDQTDRGIPGAYIKRNQIILIPPTGTGYDYIRISIYLRPGQFIETTSAAQITSINTGTNTVSFTLGTIPATFVTTQTFDFIQNKPHFDHLAIDQTAATVTSTTMIFSSLSSRLAVGDWVSLAEQSPVVQCPVELQPVLMQSTASIILQGQGDLDKLEASEKRLEGMDKRTTSLYTPRIRGEGKKLINRTGILRRQ